VTHVRLPSRRVHPSLPIDPSVSIYPISAQSGTKRWNGAASVRCGSPSWAPSIDARSLWLRHDSQVRLDGPPPFREPLLGLFVGDRRMMMTSSPCFQLTESADRARPRKSHAPCRAQAAASNSGTSCALNRAWARFAVSRSWPGVNCRPRTVPPADSLLEHTVARMRRSLPRTENSR
jgi:hypothetical protein